MDKDQRCQLFEKFYFQEIERREKISGRLGLPFAVLVAIISLLSFMLNASDQLSAPIWNRLFWTLFTSSCVTLLIGAWFFSKAWFGHTDKLLPTAYEIEQYHTKLIETYAQYPQQDELVRDAFYDFLFSYYMRFSSENAINNDQRSYNLYRTTYALTLSALLAFAAVVPFFIGRNYAQRSIHESAKTATPAATATAAKREGQ